MMRISLIALYSITSGVVTLFMLKGSDWCFWAGAVVLPIVMWLNGRQFWLLLDDDWETF